jgi:hypothetical protein
MSKLSDVVIELKMWDFRFTGVNLETLGPSNKKNVATWFLSWFIFHLIYVRIYQASLPIAMGEEGFDSISDNNAWQPEVTAVCLKHAKRIVELADSAIANDVIFNPFILYAINIITYDKLLTLTSFCLASAATVLTHAIYYNNEIATPSRANFVHILEILLEMRSLSKISEAQVCFDMHEIQKESIPTDSCSASCFEESIPYMPY